MKYSKPRVYSVWHPNDDVRMKSSSGGAFTLLAESVIKRGGCVFGAAWTSNLDVVIKCVDTVDGLALLRESKYVASKSDGAYAEAKSLLDAGREVLFSGLPCQIASLYRFLGNLKYPKLTTVDVLCHGAPALEVWKKYISHVEEQYQDRVIEVHFRNKRWGAESNLLLVVKLLRTGNKVIAFKENTYYFGFVHNFFKRTCCQACRFNSLPRQADFSLGDFRGLGDGSAFRYEKDKPKGFTGVMVNSSRANLFLKMLDMSVWCERSYEEFARGQAVLRLEDSRLPAHYADFWRDFPLMPYGELARRYLTPGNRYVAYVWARRLLGPNLFLRLGIVYKWLRGLRRSWRCGE